MWYQGEVTGVLEVGVLGWLLARSDVRVAEKEKVRLVWLYQRALLM